MEFEVPAGYAKATRIDNGDFEHPKYYAKLGNSCWFTNLEHNVRCSPIPLVREYSPNKYPKYDNYDAIEISAVKEIPKDYYGVLGVPLTYIDKYCADQFRIIGMDMDVAGPVAIAGKCKKKRVCKISGWIC